MKMALDFVDTCICLDFNHHLTTIDQDYIKSKSRYNVCGNSEVRDGQMALVVVSLSSSYTSSHRGPQGPL
jgi:hypothetical protein